MVIETIKSTTCARHKPGTYSTENSRRNRVVISSIFSMLSVRSIRCVNPRLDSNPHLGFSGTLGLSLSIPKLKNAQLRKLVVNASSGGNGVGFNDNTVSVSNSPASVARPRYDSSIFVLVWVYNMR